MLDYPSRLNVITRVIISERGNQDQRRCDEESIGQSDGKRGQWP